MKDALSRKKLLRFSQIQQHRIADYEVILLALALASDGSFDVSDDDIKAAQDALTDETEVGIMRTENGIRVSAFFEVAKS